MAIEVNPKRTGLKVIPHQFAEDEFLGYVEPGSLQQKFDGILLACPGCGRVSHMTVGHPKPSKSPSWDVVSGDLANPVTLTLSPSINCVGCCQWHGYLRNGVFESC